MLIAIVALAACIALYVLNTVVYRMKYDLHKIPSPPEYPLVGHLFDFLAMPRLNFNSWYLEWYHKLGHPKVIKRVLPGDISLVVFDMDFIKNDILGRDGMPKSQMFYPRINQAFVGDPKRNVLFSAPYLTPYYRAVRRTAASAFSSSNLRNQLPHLQKVLTRAEARIDQERQKGPIDLQDFFVDLTLDVLGEVAFDQDFGGLDGTGVIKGLLEDGFKMFNDEIFKPHLQLYMKLFPNSEPALKKRRTVQMFVDTWKKITHEVMSRPYPDASETSLWAALRRLEDPETGKPVSEDKLYGDVGVLVVAGMDTTAHQLQWIMAILSDHPDVVDKIIDELKSHHLYGSNARKLQFEDLTDLKYLNAAIKECMRLVQSTIAIGIREVTKDTEVCGYRVPKGTQVMVPANVYTHLEEHFEDPQSFKPERWLSDNAAENLYLTFSYGPRDCVGQKLGLFEIQITIIRLLSKYYIKLSEGMTYAEARAKKSYDAIVVSAEGGLFFDITERPMN